jgi:hypothetical protein
MFTRTNSLIALFITGLCLLNLRCTEKKSDTRQTTFTEADSVTEVLLDLQDSILITWNLMIKDDNYKIKAMKGLLHELEIVNEIDPGEAKALQKRIDQLTKIRYTPKTIEYENLVEEYDFASSSLVGELIALSESTPSYAYNTTMQALVEQIRTAEQRIENYRLTYDSIVSEYNSILAKNSQLLKESESITSLEKKPLFQTASE